ncbi:translation elongation factor Ts [Candidatus Curtissbacteria bacterium RIFCSPHIGHO2_02_FULL_40_17]|uniref:Elongation factor Ts n=3 Tax=Candidatus Curtissiibacteriota TaxID=1752717 RepID=A0A1F5GK22_9BACT|nr:MAG: translation elongation factor Ts [Candidatus Curtissbacteria bacterium RIFCSPHIGHO2_01_FULL_40_12]OGD92137.1 MAG: translation elongation factor Ts [Candidatus Curtissbacteria bacterium RIFCSPHIGHO2_02_FULL_40_17]OGE06304.1 MAG: translation elongation factor Ts [Candidatus Curtissbacteria bacterium RIFCSPLOWO2_02_FULL_40_13b]
MKIKVEDIKKLREETAVSIADCRKALEESVGDFKKAKELLRSWGIDKAAKKADRVVGAGLVDTYIHAGGKVASMVEVNCETDFVAKTDEFKNLAHEIAMQVSAMDPKDVEELLVQEYIRDSSKTIDDLVKEAIAKLGENIKVSRFMRFELGQ